MRLNRLSARKPFPHFFKGGPFGHISQLTKQVFGKRHACKGGTRL